MNTNRVKQNATIAIIAAKAAELAQEWHGSVLKFEIGHRRDKTLVHVRADGNRYFVARLTVKPVVSIVSPEPLVDFNLKIPDRAIRMRGCPQQEVELVVDQEIARLHIASAGARALTIAAACDDLIDYGKPSELVEFLRTLQYA